MHPTKNRFLYAYNLEAEENPTERLRNKIACLSTFISLVFKSRNKPSEENLKGVLEDINLIIQDIENNYEISTEKIQDSTSP